MKDFDKIFLSWRKGQGSRRHIVGVLKQTPEGRFVFSYDRTEVEQAKKEGFTPYTEFPDTTQFYNGQVLDIFAQRLTKPERPDVQAFYDFWEIEPQFTSDKFYLLGHTQGLLPTDNFEFLADYKVMKGLHFLTELAGLSAYQLPPDTLKPGDVLRFEKEDGNEHDKEAVKVFKGDKEIGYIKKVHCKVFHKADAENLKLTVKAIEKNGLIKRVFVKVAF